MAARGAGRGVHAATPGKNVGAGDGVPVVNRYAHGSRVPGWDEAVDLSKAPREVPDPSTTPVPAQLRTEIESHMARYPDRHSAVLSALHAAQRLHGWCSPEAMTQVACVMRVTPAYVESIATFYDMYETEPKPVDRTDVYVCTNISCSLRGADDLYEELRRAAGDDPAWNVRSFECLGACDMAPMASVNGTYVGPLTLDDARRILEDVRAGRPVLEAKQVATRPSTDREAADAPPPRPQGAGAPPAGATASEAGPGTQDAKGRAPDARPTASGGPEGGEGGARVESDRRPEEGGA